MAEGWQGAIIIDDPLKVEDAYSKTYREKANRKLQSTVKSRKATPDTPIIVIMQRLAEEDPTGFIKEGNLPGEWEFVEIPALITDEYVAALPERLRKLVEVEERDKDGRFSYWSYKEPLADQLEMERVAPYVHSGQYMQRPSPLGGGIIKSAWFPRYTVLPRILYRKIFVDTAQKTAERNDYSVFHCWGAGDDGRIYLLDQIRDKWKAPELRQAALDFWAKHKPYDHRMSGPLREMVIEDKASGTGLIQDIQKHGSIPVRPLPRDTDKLRRVMDVNSYWAAGLVLIPADAPWVLDFTNELNAFTADDTHAHDDQVDPLVDATTDMLANVSDWSAWN